MWSEGYSVDSPIAGHDAVLTLDRHVQFAAEEVLEKTVLAHRARSGMAVVLDTATSEILALANYPTFNPNNLSGSTVNQRKNRVVADIYDPGSTAKIVTLAAALESKVVTPKTPVDCEEGRWRVGNRTIRDANHRFGVLSVTEVMRKSSNIGAGKIALLMGKKKLHEYLVRFGFGRRTGIEVPGEVQGILRPAARWREVDHVNIAFGQGVSVTPIQVAQAANVIAAGGVLRPPTLVRGVQTAKGNLTSIRTRTAKRIVSKQTADALTEMMSGVTGPDGTAPKAAVPGFTVAGKTGTAQKYDPELKAYSREKYVASFVGFLPAEDPEVTVLVVVDEPKDSIYGGYVAGPAFKDIATAALASKDLYPSSAQLGADASSSTVRADPGAEDRGDPEAAVERAVADIPAEAAALAENYPESPPPGLEGSLSRKARSVLGDPLPSDEAPTLSAGPEGRMPDLRGLFAVDALVRCADLKLDPHVRGLGRVHRQMPPPGALLERGMRCALELRRDG